MILFFDSVISPSSKRAKLDLSNVGSSPRSRESTRLLILSDTTGSIVVSASTSTVTGSVNDDGPFTLILLLNVTGVSNVVTRVSPTSSSASSEPIN